MRIKILVLVLSICDGVLVAMAIEIIKNSMCRLNVYLYNNTCKVSYNVDDIARIKWFI